ncbi:replicative DNA helicase [Limibaculum sp. M0105]|uniref:Replicative DNA helicase n=1 Tax=Thermohalobaculum xanthum TaxID=2753746 RepID=A0A8J7M3S6_9RHOB|nr:replicative DNA helicase [Thermohalobaculum xanthum]MBK0397673.1 replicative DNA helicase [Thermohalobaculum xanthum]
MADGARPGEQDVGGSVAQPHNIEAEQALLGALLLNNDVFNHIEAIVQPHHFYDPVHGRIFKTAARLIARNALASPVTLKSFMADDEGLTELGGPEYLARLAASTISVLAARDYAQTIRDLALRRDLIRIADEITSRATAFDVESDPVSQITEAEQALYTLAETGKYEGGFTDFASAAAAAANVVNLAFQRGGGLAGTSSGIATLDYRLGGLRNSDLLILAGRPSMGKTALATNIAFNMARARLKSRLARPDADQHDGAVVGFFSLEMSSEQLANRILASEAQIKSHLLLSGELDEGQFRRFLEVARELEQIPLYIDDTPALPISTLAARARRLKRQVGLDCLVIDYLQLVRPASGRADGRVQEVSEITQGLKAIAKELEIPVLALSQLSRKVEERDDKRPQLADLRESGSIEQDADVVMFVFREAYYHDRAKPPEDDPRFPEWQQKAERLHGRAEVIIGKQRHGPIGTAELHFEDSFTRFSDLARDRDFDAREGGGYDDPGFQ